MRIPVLCYHRIEHPPAGASGDSNFVTPELFVRHLAVLARSGFTGITVRELLRWQREGGPMPRRPMAVTFDDGYASVMTHALPLLAQHGWPCTVFAVSAYVGGRNVWDVNAPPATLLDAEALRQLLADGHDVGSHTRHHRRIRGLQREAAMEELAGARQDLEQLLGAACQSVAFPYGSHDATAVALVRDAGYAGALTLKRWTNGKRTNPLRLGRMSVGGPLPPWQLLAKLTKMALTPAFA